MTSKEKLKDIKALINEIYSDCSEDNQIKSKKVFLQYCDDIEKELTHQPTFEECIKEWEERGWEVEKTSVYMSLKCVSNHNPDYYCYIFINITSKSFFAELREKNKTQPLVIGVELLNLIHKTLKALEEMKDEKEN